MPLSTPIHRHQHRRTAPVLAGIGLVLLSVVAGCNDPVMTPDEPRSQYDRFDTVRDQRAPSYVYDEFGNRKPNIRSRLLAGE
jgi:hypothetical protein